MNNTDLEKRIRELEHELSIQKSNGAKAGKAITEAKGTRKRPTGNKNYFKE